MNEYKIPFNQAYISGKETEYMARAIERSHISGSGSFTVECQKLLEELLDVPKVLLTTSCTHALEMAAFLLDIQPGDEVIIPSFTFVSTANAFVIRGAHPIFIDIKPDTLNLDENYLLELVSSKTKAILPVHYAGVGCDMDEILETVNRQDIAIIEDNAHGLFGKYRDRHLGTFGKMATLSFHETKNITCGEGGALIVNDPGLVERAEIIREKGTDRSRFYRGLVDKYTWVDSGSSYIPSDILAAFLLAQLESRIEIQEKRQSIWDAYHLQLAPWANENGVQLPTIPSFCEQSYHMYYLLLPDIDSRQALINHLSGHGILSVFHYIPLHISRMGKRFGGKLGDCPVSEAVSERLIRLPFHTGLQQSDQQMVIEAVWSFKV